MSDRLLNLVSVLQEDLPAGGDVKIHYVENGELDYILYGEVFYDNANDYPSSNIDLTRVIDHKDEFEKFEIKTFHNQEVFGLEEKDIGRHNVAVRVKE
jgi:hypothetical protein